MPLDNAHCLRTPWLRRFPWDKVKGGWRLRQAEFDLFQARAARWILRHASSFDIIQICELPELVLRLKRARCSIPLVVRLTAPNYYDPHNALPLADARIASGTSIAKLRERGLDVHDIPNAVDTDLFHPHPSPWREQNNVPATAYVALYTARFQAFKNHDLLLRAWAKVAAARPDALLVLAGSGPLLDPSRALADSLGISSSVRFLGPVPYDSLPDLYAASDLGVISSDYESFCFSVLEMMSSGLPVVTTDCGWPPRLVADGAGLVVPVRDPDALSAAILRLASTPTLAQSLAAIGRRLATTRHSWPASATALLSLYHSLLPQKIG
jgi:glycosyltransferase involved in cell wall biosynthesis